MGRCYHLSKTVTEDLANEIIKELTKRGDVKLARMIFQTGSSTASSENIPPGHLWQIY